MQRGDWAERLAAASDSGFRIAQRELADATVDTRPDKSQVPGLADRYWAVLLWPGTIVHHLRDADELCAKRRQRSNTVWYVGWPSKREAVACLETYSIVSATSKHVE